MKCFTSLCVLALAGCANQAPTFSWYHSAGGEYLFAYDSNECTKAVTDHGASLGTELDGPFFRCMHERGYYLIDGDRIVQAPPAVAGAREQQVSQQ